MTLACCLRREALADCRRRAPHMAAGAAVEAYLVRHCAGVREALKNAVRDGPWLSVGPVRPGIRLDSAPGVFRVGNAAGETHPLIGEGISMALQSAALLAKILTKSADLQWTAAQGVELQRRYAAAWRSAFAPRIRLSGVYAGVAMRPWLAGPTRTLLVRWPMLLGGGARLAGKASRAAVDWSNTAEIA